MPPKANNKKGGAKPKPQTPAEPQKAASGITEPVDVVLTTATELTPEPIYNPLDERQSTKIKALAIQLCLAEGHRNPFSYSFGKPKYMSNWPQARAMVVAHEFMNAEAPSNAE